MPRSFLVISFFSVILGCATTSIHDTRVDKKLSPPSQFIISKWSTATPQELRDWKIGSQEHNIQWWRSYTLAQKIKKSAPQEACENFLGLAKNAEFALNELALIRAHEVCPQQTILPALPEESTSWYRELNTDLILKEALTSKESEKIARAYLGKAKVESNRKRKEDYYLSAQEEAKKIQNEELTTLINEVLYKNSPRLKPAIGAQDYTNVASDFRFHRQFTKAVEYYQKVLANKKLSPDTHYSALKSIRQTYKVAQNKAEYVKATQNLANWSQKQFKTNKKDKRAVLRYHDAQILLAKTLWTEDQTSKAVIALQTTLKDLNKLYPMDEVYFILGRIDEEKGNFTKALEYFELSYKEPVSFVGLRDKIAWLKSWNYFKLEKFAEAKISFEEMRDSVQENSDKSKARFWLARSLKKLNQNEEAQKELESLEKEDPIGYYGMLATRELNKKFLPLSPHPENIEQLSFIHLKALDLDLRYKIEWLLALDEKDFAEKAINQASDKLKDQKISNSEVWFTIAATYARAGRYLQLFAMMSSLDSDAKTSVVERFPELLFPQAYGDIIISASNKTQVPAEFIFSIIRQESAFNPEARSPADAFGLMQLLPSVAKKLATQYKLAYGEANDLFIPEINVPLGAAELKNLMRKYSDQFILSVSGYNANDGAIRGWLKTRYRNDSVEFIEEVPYEETRNYIKLVMRNYLFYQRLTHKEPLPFPEKLLVLTGLPGQNSSP